MWNFLVSLLSPRGKFFWKGLIAAELLFRVWMIFFFWSPMDLIYSDMHRHWDNAAHFLTPGVMASSNPISYQIWLWFFRTITHDHRFSMNLMALLLSFAGLGVWYAVARRVATRQRTALIYTAILGAIPTHALMYMYFMPETLLVPLTGAALILTIRAMKRPGVFRFWGAALVWLFTIHTKSVALPVAFLSFLWSLSRQKHRILLFIPVVLIAAASFFAVGHRAEKYFGRNTALGDSTLVSIYFASAARDYQVTWGTKRQGMGVYVFSSPSFYISPFYPFKWESSRKGMVKFALDPTQHGRDVQKTLATQIAQNKEKMPRLIFENFIFLSFGHHWPLAGLGNTSGKVCVWERIIWFPIFVFSTIGCLWWWRRRRAFFPIITLFATMALYGSQITVMEGRYRKFIEPIALLGVVASAERWVASRRLRMPKPKKKN
jgi:Dolichyl-phosphate-mannose-protein mannosyltransferase